VHLLLHACHPCMLARPVNSLNCTGEETPRGPPQPVTAARTFNQAAFTCALCWPPPPPEPPERRDAKSSCMRRVAASQLCTHTSGPVQALRCASCLMTPRRSPGARLRVTACPRLSPPPLLRALWSTMAAAGRRKMSRRTAKCLQMWGNDPEVKYERRLPPRTSGPTKYTVQRCDVGHVQRALRQWASQCCLDSI